MAEPDASESQETDKAPEPVPKKENEAEKEKSEIEESKESGKVEESTAKNEPKPEAPEASTATSNAPAVASSKTSKSVEEVMKVLEAEAAVPPANASTSASQTAVAATTEAAPATTSTNVPTATVTAGPTAPQPSATTVPASETSVAAPATSALPNASTTNNNSKKRKLPTKPLAVTQLLTDYPVIQQTVRDLLALLQSYGPLTAGQLEYNLPPVAGERLHPKSLHDILEVLVCIGLVQQVDDKNSTTTTTPRYCCLQGIPRPDVVLPTQLMDDIRAAHQEMDRSYQRRQVLIQALQNSSTPKDTLKRLLHDFPEIVQDPVYLTALKNCHVDLAAADRERRMARAGAAAKKTTTKETHTAKKEGAELPVTKAIPAVTAGKEAAAADKTSTSALPKADGEKQVVTEEVQKGVRGESAEKAEKSQPTPMDVDKPAAGTEETDGSDQKSTDAVEAAAQVGTTGLSNKEKINKEEISEKLASVEGKSAKQEVLGGIVEMAVDKEAAGDKNASDKTT